MQTSQKSPSTEPALVNILGVGISNLNMKSAVQASQLLLEESNWGYICVAGVHGIIGAQNDEKFCHIHNRPLLKMPDGMITVWLGHLLSFFVMKFGQEYVSRHDYNLSAPCGANGRNSVNTLIQQYLEWEPTVSLIVGLRKTFDWIGMEIEETYAATR